jgi:hypothetical protein
VGIQILDFFRLGLGDFLVSFGCGVVGTVLSFVIAVEEKGIVRDGFFD